MQKQQVFKVKGMQRDASMANANGEFAYEILNMRLMPAEDLSGFSLTNEKGTLATGITLKGQVIGQCPTNDSLVVFTTSATYNENNERTGGLDCIYEIYQTSEGWPTDLLPLYEGDLNFHADKHIEALFNYETENIQKVYWIDDINQLRCINLVGEIQEGNNQQFDSVKEINSLPSVEIERVVGGSFTAGVIQYYITYFNKNSSESPIVYTSPLLYIAHDNRGANVNDQVSTAFKLTFTDLDTTNWEYMRIYITHRTSIDATPEASIVTELNMDNSTIEFTDYGSNRTSIAPTDLYFTGGKFVKAGTMTVKDQVMFLGNLNIETPETVSVVEIQHLFDSIRDNEDHPFTTTTRKTKENKLEEYEDTHYYYKNQLNNTESITHYKYGEKYRFGISVLDKYGNWSNPIWVKDAFIEVPPEQVDSNTLELPCPSLNLSYSLTYNNETKTLLKHLQDRGAIDIKPIVVFPKEDERKVIAQGVVCPTVYNLKDRKENGPYTQASWFMRPNAPVDLWGIDSKNFGKSQVSIAYDSSSDSFLTIPVLSHKSDIQILYKNNPLASYYGIGRLIDDGYDSVYNNGLSAFDYLYDDFSADSENTTDSATDRNGLVTGFYRVTPESVWEARALIEVDHVLNLQQRKNIVDHGSWTEFRHNYALRSKGWSFGAITPGQSWDKPELDSNNRNWGMARGAELDTTRFSLLRPTNRFGLNAVLSDVVLTSANVKIAIKDVKVSAYNTVLLLYNIPNTNKYIQVDTLDGYIELAQGIVAFLQISKNGYEALSKAKSSEDYNKMESLFGLDFPVMVWEFEESILNTFLSDVYPNSIDIPNTDAFLESEEDAYSLSNSAYYVDSSIVTLNSPEIELNDINTTSEDLNFRIIGCIPLTATISDTSIEVTDPSSDPQQGIWGRTGLYKINLSNKNIGYHGFKGMVASSAYYSYYADSNGGVPNYYGMVPLYPWNSTGTVGICVPDNTNKKDNLKRKILSNLRFSANTFYFKKGECVLYDDNSNNIAYLENSSIGWKPQEGQSVYTYTGVDDTPILKLSGIYPYKDLVYRGATSDEGTLTSLTQGSSNTPIDSLIYGLGQRFNIGDNAMSGYNNPETLLYSPAVSSSMYYKPSQGALVKYKSSPHYVIAFNPIKLEDNKAKWIQETLPTWRTLNEEGLTSDSLSKYNTILDHGYQYENQDVSSLYHQSYLEYAGDHFSFGLPNTVPSRKTSLVGFYEEDTDLEMNEINSLNINPYGSISSVYWKPTIEAVSYISTTSNNDTKVISIKGSGKENYASNVNTWVSSEIDCSIYLPSDFYTKLLSKLDEISPGDNYTWNEGSNSKVYLKTSINKPNGTSYENCQIRIDKLSSSSSRRRFKMAIAHPLNTYEENRFKIELNTVVISNIWHSGQQIDVPNYGWLWLGEVYRETDPTFGGTSDFALQNNQWENGGSKLESSYILQNGYYYIERLDGHLEVNNEDVVCDYTECEYDDKILYFNISDQYQSNLMSFQLNDFNVMCSILKLCLDEKCSYLTFEHLPLEVYITENGRTHTIDSFVTIEKNLETHTLKFIAEATQSDDETRITKIQINDIPMEAILGNVQHSLMWTQGDTYYQRFDTLKTYAYSDSDQNSVIDITSFMVETRINIDGRTDRNKGQENNLQMSPTNFNLINNVYSQRDNFFTYRILDEDLQARTNFPNQITWSLTKTAGATVDAWMNITLASVLDLDGTKGELTALKNFNNNIIAFQEKGLSNIMFNSRAQIATSEAVPIQIANTGKVDGQQYFTTNVGCQDKWNIVTTPNGLYFVDYFNKSIYRFNGQLEDISTPNGFRSWCYENLNSTANILGYYDVKNKEVIYYIGDTGFMLDNSIYPGWLGFSELTGAFSSFYTYPKAWFANVQDRGLWLLSGDNTNVYTHQTGEYNQLLNTSEPFYGLTVIPRQDSNTVKTFNNVEFRADSFDGNGYNEDLLPVDTISAETEYQPRTTDSLVYNKYRPSNLKKKFRTWRANIPRVNNGYNRFVNQWAKIGLWKMNPSTEKTILHDLSVWYSE